MTIRPRHVLAVLCSTLVSGPWVSAEPDFGQVDGAAYRRPPPVLEELALARRAVARDADAGRRRLLVAEPANLVPVSQLAWPEARLRALRYYPRAAARVEGPDYLGLAVCEIPGAEHCSTGDLAETAARCRDLEPVGDEARLRHPLWDPAGVGLAFARLHRDGLELRFAVLTPGDGPDGERDLSHRRVADVRLHDLMGPPCTFWPDGGSLLCRLAMAPGDVASAESAPAPSSAPEIRDTALSAVRPAPPDLGVLRSRVARVHLDGRVRQLVEPGLWRRVELSPDGRWLLVERLGTSVERFEVRPVDGGSPDPVAASRPLASRPGRVRAVAWRADAPAILSWFETTAGDADGPTDRLWLWPAPFTASASPAFATGAALQRVVWGTADLAVAELLDRSGASRSRLAFDPSRPERSPVPLAEWPAALTHGDPAVPLTHPLAAGGEVLELSPDGRLWVRGRDEGSDSGLRPTLALQDPATGALELVWQSPEDAFERPVALAPVTASSGNAGVRFLTSRQAEGEPGNIVLRSPGAPPFVVTDWRPSSLLAEVEHRRLSYARRDGLPLTASLYLPPAGSGGDGGEPAPMIFWAYPQSFDVRADAARSDRPAARSLRLDPLSPLLWLARGYAVLEPDMPIVAEGGLPGNDSWREQLVQGAEAAVAAAAATGAVDPGRVAVIGHSYGAHMAVGLLAHSELFRAGVALSGAYNRTLSPYGFQDEARTLWQAEDVYRRMSPIFDADQLTAPLLLIHGRQDANPATRPEESERLFEALRFLDRPARLVLLPHEGHRPRGRESVLHVLWEIDRWLELHLGAEGDQAAEGSRPRIR